MAANNNKITFGIDFQVDKASLNQVRSALANIQKATISDVTSGGNTIVLKKQLDQAKQAATQVEKALQKAYNPKIDSVNISKFNSELQKTGLTLNDVYQSWSKLGSVGQTAFTGLSTNLLTVGNRLKQTQSLIDKMGQTFVNTVKWNVASSAVNGFQSAISNAYNYVKVLDGSLNDIRIVTGQSREEMDKFAVSANQAAQNLGRQTKDYTQAYLTYTQQGLSPTQSAQRTQATLKASNITGQDTSTMADDLTAMWNGYQIAPEDTEKAVSKLAAVADTSASDMSQLATAMSKSASIAHNMGVTIDQLAAQIATITQVTRQAPETTGNAIKTILARINDIKAGTDEAQTSLGNYTSKMAALGVNVLDANGKLRDTGDTITQVGNRWGTMTKEQQVYLAQTMAGQRQMNNLIALFDNWDTYTKELNTSLNATNELDVKNDIYMQSLGAHLNELQAAGEGLIQAFSDTDSFKNVIDFGTELLNVFTKLVDSIGGGGTAVAALATSFGRLFSKQIGNEINNLIISFQNLRYNAQQIRQVSQQTKLFADVNGIQNNEAVSQMVKYNQQIADYRSIMSKEEQEDYDLNLKTFGIETQRKNNLQQQVDMVLKYNAALKAGANGKNANSDLLTQSKVGQGKSYNALLNANKKVSTSIDEINEKYKTFMASQQEVMKVPIAKRSQQDLESLQKEFIDLEKVVKALRSQFNDNEVPQSLEKLNNRIEAISSSLMKNKGGLGSNKNLLTQELEKVNQQAQQATSSVQNLGKTEQELDKSNSNLNALTSNLDNIVNSNKQRFNVETITSLGFAVGQLASSISSLGNIGSIINDKDLTNTEKFAQIVSNLTITLPMLVSSIGGISSKITTLYKQTSLYEVPEADKKAAENLQNLAKQRREAANATSDATKKQQLLTQADNLETQATNTLNASLKSLSMTLDIAMVAITAAIAIYQAWTQAQHEARLAAIDLANSNIETEKSKQEQNQANLDLIKNYQDLYDQYKKGAATKDEMSDAAQKLSGIIGNESLSVAELTGNYDRLTEAVNKERQAELKKQAASTKKQVKEVQNSATPTFKEAGGSIFNGSDTGTVNVGKATKDVNDFLENNLPQIKSGASHQLILETGTSADELYQTYKDVVETLDKITDPSQRNTKAVQNLIEWRQKMTDWASKYEEANNGDRDANAALKATQLFNDDVKTIDDFETKKKEFADWLEKKYGSHYDSKDDLNDAVNNYIRNNTNSTIQGFNVTSSSTDDVVKDLNKNIQDQARDLLNKAGLSSEGYDYLINFKVNKETSLEDFKEYIKLASKLGEDAATDATTDAVDKVSDIIQKAHDQRQQDTKSGNTKITKGKTYTKDDKEAIQGLQGMLTDDQINQIGRDRLALLEDQNASLKDQYAVLQQIREITTQKNLNAVEYSTDQGEAFVNSQKDQLQSQIDKLEEQKEALQVSIDSGDSSNISGDTEKIKTLTSQIEELKEQLDQISGQDWEVTVRSNVDKNLLDYFEGQVQTLGEDSNLLAQAASLVGENYRVAATDVATLADIFPQILDGAQTLADGSVQLNQQTVQQVLGGQAAVLQGDTATVNGQLQNQISLLDAEIAYCDQKIGIYKDVLNGKITTDQAAKKIDAATTQYSAQMADLMGESWVNANVQAANNHSNTTNAILSNLHLIGYEAANVSQVQAKAMAGEATNYSPVSGQASSKLTTKGAYSDSSDKVAAFAKKNNTSDTTAKQQMKAIEDQLISLEKEASSARSTRNSLVALQAKNTANTANAQQKANYANQGLGGSYNPESTKNKNNKNKNKGNQENLKSEDEILKDLISDAEKLEDVYEKQADTLSDQIKRLEREVDKLNKTSDKTIRSGRIKTIDKEVAKLREEKDLYQQQIELSKKQQENEINKIKLYAQQLGFTQVQIDAQGNVLNYQQLANQYQQEYNDLLYKEAAATSKDVQDAYAKQAQLVQERWKNFQSSTETLQKYSDAIDDAEDKIDDLQDTIEEDLIKQFTIEIDVRLDINKAKRDWNQFRKEVIDDIKDDDYLGQAQARITDFDTYYNSAGTGDVQSLLSQVNATRDALQRIQNGDFSSAYGRNEQQAREDLKKYTDDLTQALKDSKQINKDIHEYYLDEIEKAKQAFDDQNDLYKQINDTLEHDANLTKLLHGDEDYEDLEKFYDATEKNNNQQLDFYRKQVDMWKRQMDAAEEGSDEWKKFKENWMSSISDLNSAVEDAVQNLIDKYNNTINKIVKQTKDSLMGGDWQKAMDEWDKAKWNQDRYLDRASRATGVLDFIDNVNKAMDKQSPKVQKELATFMDREVDDLNGIVNMRQIDLDIANKKLEVLQKQIALEDAQNAKTQMRLRRDSQGNYTYQYVADEDQTAQAQQDLRDSIEELRLLAKNDVSDSLDEMQDKLQDFFDKALELNQTYYDDSDTLHEKLRELQDEYFGEDGYCILTAQDYQNMQKNLIDLTGSEFGELLKGQGDKLQAFLGLSGDDASDQSVWQSIKALMGDDGAIPTLLDGFTTGVYQDNLNAMTQGNQELLFGKETGLNPSWNTAIGNMGMDFINLTSQVVMPAMQSMFDANVAYIDSLGAVQQAAGIVFNDVVKNGIDPTIVQTQNLLLGNEALVSGYDAEITAVGNVCTALGSLQDSYKATTAAAIDAANAALKLWAAVQGYTLGDVYSGGNQSFGGGSFTATPTSGSGRNGSSSGNGDTSGSSNAKSTGKTPSASTDKTQAKERFVNLDDDDDLTHNRKRYVSQYLAGGDSSQVQGTKNATGYDTTHRRISGTTAYATGGYTGEWADGSRDGKLAFLHQKELILNENDTKNMLSVVGIVRGIVDTVSSVSGNMLSGLSSNSSLSRFFGIQSNNSAVQQEVHIDATFPNVESSQEIEKAFNNLVNAASQRANINRRKY